MWGRKGSNSYVINGEFIYQGLYNNAPYYRKVIDPSYAPYNVTYLWQYAGSYYLTDDEPHDLSTLTYRGKCNIPSADPISCGLNWGIPSLDTNVFAQNAPCPQWDCDGVITTDIGNSCDQNFNIKIAPNAWSNSAGDRYWYYNHNMAEWVCDNVYELKHGSFYAYTNNVWTYTTKGTNVNLLFSFPDTNIHTIQCIDDNPPTYAPSTFTNNPSISPTYVPSSATNSPTYTPTISLTINPTGTTSHPTLLPTYSPQIKNDLIVQNPTYNEHEVIESYSTTNNELIQSERENNSDGLTHTDAIIYVVIGVVVSCCIMSILIAIVIGYCFWRHKIRIQSDKSDTITNITMPKLSIKKLSDKTSPKLTDHDSLRFTPEGLINVDKIDSTNIFITTSENVTENKVSEIQMFDIYNTPGMSEQSQKSLDSIKNIPPGSVVENIDSIGQIIDAARLDQIIDSDDSSHKNKIDLAVTDSEMSDGMYQTPRNNYGIKMFGATSNGIDEIHEQQADQ